MVNVVQAVKYENTSVTIKNYGGAGVYNITVETWVVNLMSNFTK